MTVTTADAAIAAGKFSGIFTNIEGLRAADLLFGAGSAKTVTLQFGVKAPAGTYCVAIRNAAPNRTYVTEYTVAAGEANTDVIKSVTIPGDVTGTWAADNTIGLSICFCLMAGSTYQTPAGIWTAGNFLGSSNQFNFMGTNGNVFELFDVGLYQGSAPPAFQVPDYASELALCLRYWETGICRTVGSTASAGLSIVSSAQFAVPKRIVPTMTNSNFVNNANASGVSGAAGAQSVNTLSMGIAVTTGSTNTDASYVWKANARM
jgi:hypothetical protein